MAKSGKALGYLGFGVATVGRRWQNSNMSSTHGSGVATGVALREALSDAVSALGRVGELVAAGAHLDLTGLRCAAESASLLGALSIGEAAVAVLARRADTSGELRPAGFASMGSYLRDGVGIAEGRAHAVVARGRALHRYPSARHAVLTGDISCDAARVLAEAVDKAVADVPRDERAAVRADGEAVMLPLARAVPVSDLAAAGAKLVDALDPESTVRRQLEAHEQQTLSCARVGSQYVVKGVLELETGAALVTILETMVDQRYRSGDLRDDEQSTGDEAEDERRRRRARGRLWAEAFGDLVRGVLDDGTTLGTRHGVAPHLTLIVEQAGIDGGLGGELLVPGEPDPVLLPNETVQRILCDARVTEVVTAGSVPDLEGRDLDPPDPSLVGRADLVVDPAQLLPRRHHVLWVGPEHRTAPPRLRRALEARDRHCRFPGCRVSIHRCEAHHVLEWEHGGDTCISNMVLLCRAHHTFVHEGGWSVTADPEVDAGHPHYWSFTPPDPGRP